MHLKFAGVAAGLLVLAGCAEPVAYNPVAEPVNTAPSVIEPIQPTDPVAVSPLGEGGIDPALALVEVDPYGDVQQDAASGLTERLPDTCKLESVQQYRGQSGSAVDAAGLTVPYRIVGPSDIVTQEYNPTRVNFFLNTGGTVDRISCG